MTGRHFPAHAASVPQELVYEPAESTPPAADFFDEPVSGQRQPSASESGGGDAMVELEQSDLAELLGPGGPLAALLDDYELRPSQLEMAQAVKRALVGHEHAVVEAPTGTGKSIAYLLPAILAGRTVVVSTANKSLQSQLFQKEIPFLRKLLGKPIPTVVVKGRSNYICNLKWEREVEEQRYISLYDREDEQVRHMRGWLGETVTGDVDELPFVLGADLRPRVVSFPDDCLHADCPHAEDNCWVNHMRDEASQAQILITNHHLLLNALELGWAGERILPPASIYVVDEAHHLEQIATSVYETVVTDYTVEQLLQRAAIKDNAEEEELDELRFLSARAFQETSNLSRENAYRLEGELESMKALGSRLARLAQRMKQANPYAAAVEQAAQTGQRPDGETAERNRHFELALEALSSAATKLQDSGRNQPRRPVRPLRRPRLRPAPRHSGGARRPHQPGRPPRPLPLPPGGGGQAARSHGRLHQRHPGHQRQLSSTSRRVAACGRPAKST